MHPQHSPPAERNTALNEIEEKFALLEKRVNMLVSQNKDLKARIKELDRELSQVRREARKLEGVQGEKLHIREKIERILKTLDNL